MRQKKFAILFWLLVVAAAGYVLYDQSKKSVIQYESLDDPSDYLDAKLAWIINPDSSKIGRADCIIKLNDSFGKPVTEIWVTEGEFNMENVDPSGLWQDLLKDANAIVLNSPDERYSCDGVNTNTLVSKICQGCQIEELKGLIKNPGDVIITECNGLYGKNGLFSYVANGIVVNWRYLDSVSNISNIYYDSTVNAIWKDNAQRVVSNVFTAFQRNFTDRRKPVPKILVFTGVGTNIGNVPIDFLYRNFFRVLDSNYRNGKVLPEKIFINLYRKQIARESNVIFYSLRNGFLSLFSDLSAITVKRYVIEWYEIIGLCFGTLFLLLFMPLFLKRQILSYTESVINRHIFLLTVGHFFAGYGFLKVLEKVQIFSALISSLKSPFVFVILGFIAVPLSFIIPFARQLVKKGD